MRILFVDDDEKLLRGMRRMLLAKRDAWEMDFVTGGREALETLSAKDFDVIVADMRMPGMDGAELLGHVRRRHPGVVRIVLSGYSERDYIMRAVRTAHQFLSKPCSEGALLEVLEGVFNLRSIFTDRKIRDAVTRLDSLPTLPDIYAQLQAELGKEDSSLARVGEIVARDVGLSAGILKMVNSSFFGLKRAINTPGQAAEYLGLDVLRGLILSDRLFAPLDKIRMREMSFDRLWRHSLSTARFARAIAEQEGQEGAVCDQSFVTGLLHDVGKLVLVQSLKADYMNVIALVRTRNVPIKEAEDEVLGVTHAQIGGYLLGLWGFDSAIVLSVVAHNDPARAVGSPGILPYVHAANSMEHELVRINAQYAPHPMDERYFAANGLSDRPDVWRRACARLLEQGGAA